MEFITFLLAPIGFAGLAMITVLASHGRTSPALSAAAVTVIVVHVLMVWHVRFGWKFSNATRDGFAGFLVFHAALLAIVASQFVPPAAERVLLIGAFAVVTFGAIAATYEYEVVRNYRWPVIVIALAGGIGILFRPAMTLMNRLAG